MDLVDYLERIGYDGEIKPDLACLKAIHRAHALNIPYENIDVQLGRPVDLDIERIFNKIVIRKRGGWCFEMNGLLDWALREIGFDVKRVNGGVRREEFGDEMVGNHLVLLVQLDRTYLADVGIGDMIREPTPLIEGAFEQYGLPFRLDKLYDGFWRMNNHPLANPASFDFRTDPADEALFEKKNLILQTDPESNFMLNFFCFQMQESHLVSLVGRMLETIAPKNHTKHLILSPEELEDTIADQFGIIEPEVKSLWPQICNRHVELFGN